MRRRIGWRTFWPRRRWARDGVWRCCCGGRWRRWWRWWGWVGPAARIVFMRDDAPPTAAITSTGLRSRLDGHDVVVIEVDDPGIATHPSTGLPAPAPNDLAYLIYTS